MRRTRETGWKFSNVGYAGRGVNGEGAFPASPPVLKRLDGWSIVVTILRSFTCTVATTALKPSHKHSSKLTIKRGVTSESAWNTLSY